MGQRSENAIPVHAFFNKHMCDSIRTRVIGDWNTNRLVVLNDNIDNS